MRTAATLVSVLFLALVPAGSATSQEDLGATTVFARIGDPGTPEGIAVAGDRVYVGTHAPQAGNAGAGPSKVFVYDLAGGEELESYEVQGQNLSETHGLIGFAPGKQDVIYVTDRSPARVLRIDFGTTPPTQTTYATFPDLAPCHTGATPCSPTTTDLPAFLDGIAFDRDGNAYVSDFQQATIFRVPPGGGEASVWFADARLESVYGPNGLAFDKSGDMLFVAMTGAMNPPETGRGIIHTLPRVDSPNASDLGTFFTYPDPAAGPDGIAFGKSGRLYVALAGANAVSVLSPDGTETARFPDAVANRQQEIPYDMPASLAFDDHDRSLLVTNHSYFTQNRQNWAVLEAFVDDTALKLEEEKL